MKSSAVELILSETAVADCSTCTVAKLIFDVKCKLTATLITLIIPQSGGPNSLSK